MPRLCGFGGLFYYMQKLYWFQVKSRRANFVWGYDDDSPRICTICAGEICCCKKASRGYRLHKIPKSEVQRLSGFKAFMAAQEKPCVMYFCYIWKIEGLVQNLKTGYTDKWNGTGENQLSRIFCDALNDISWPKHSAHYPELKKALWKLRCKNKKLS